MYDVAIIGAGICGAATAYYLSAYKLSVCVIEKENDVSMGTTKANSAIIHAGYDPEPGTLMARLNLRGSELCHSLAAELGFAYSQTGSYVLAFSAEEDEAVKELYERGKANGVKGLEIHTREQILAREPRLSAGVTSGLFAPTAAVVSPWGMCLALCENAAVNGVEFLLSSPVSGIERSDNGFEITAGNKTVSAKYVVNAAGIDAAEVCGLLGRREFEIHPSKGQYYLLDKSEGEKVSTVLFQCPSKLGKGVLVARTVAGNLIVGPNAEPDSTPHDLSTDRTGLEYVKTAAAKTLPNISYRDNVRNFAGLRANSNRPDFIIEPSEQDSRFINVAGIKSPGLSSAPAIGEEVVGLLQKQGLELISKEKTIKAPKRIAFASLSNEEKAKLIAKNPAYGNVVCRCNTITEGEVLAALDSPITPHTLDGIKRRAGTGMGRCQGGFCSPRVHDLISQKLGIPYEKVEQEKSGSYIVCGKLGEERQ